MKHRYQQSVDPEEMGLAARSDSPRGEWQDLTAELGAIRCPVHRLDFRGNRRINSVLYIASVTQQRSQPEAAAYLARKATEGKTRREARRAHKRQLANRIIRRMWRDEIARQQPHALAA